MVDGTEPLTVQGVVADFHFESMQQPIKPQLFFSVNSSNNYRFLSFKLKPGNVNESIMAIQQKWKSLLPDARLNTTLWMILWQVFTKVKSSLKKRPIQQLY